MIGGKSQCRRRWLERTALDLLHRGSERESDKVVARRVEQVAAASFNNGVREMRIVSPLGSFSQTMGSTAQLNARNLFNEPVGRICARSSSRKEGFITPM